MAKSNNQKGKILYLERFLRDTGENRVVTMQDILAYLLENGIRAERKSIYDDIEVLRSFGMDIRFRRGRPGGYYIHHADSIVTESDAVVSAIKDTALTDPDPSEGGYTESTGSENENAEDAASEEETDIDDIEAVREKPAQEKEDESLQTRWNALSKDSLQILEEVMERDWQSEFSEQDHSAEKQVKFLCTKEGLNLARTYFGKDMAFKEKEKDRDREDLIYVATGTTMEGAFFFGWLAAMGTRIKLVKPKRMVQNYRDYLRILYKDYK